MSAGDIDVVDSRHPELTVCGYVRKNYRCSIPVAILHLMESFYSLWIKHRVSSEQLQWLKEGFQRLKSLNGMEGLGEESDIRFHVYSLPMKGFRMEVVLKAFMDNIEGEALLWLAMNPSPEMDFMAGNLAVAYDGDHAARSHWERTSEGMCMETYGRCFRESDVQNLDDLSISAYIDITQIKWKDQEKEDFDITPTLKGCGRHQWLIDDDIITTLDADSDDIAVVHCQSQNGWTIDIYRSFGEQGLEIGIYPSFKPINVDSVLVEMTVQWEIDGKRHCFKGVGGNRKVFDVGLTFDDIQSKMELIFEWKIVGVKGMNNQDIPVLDWLSNSIDVGENE